MIIAFEIPEIRDSCELDQLCKQTEVFPQELAFLKNTQELRKQFKTIVNHAKIKDMKKLGDDILNYLPSIEQYFKTNVDLIFAQRPLKNPGFRYQSFISNAGELITDSNTTQESAAAEILMVRYGLAFAILHSTIDQIHTIHSLSAQTYVPLPEDSTLIKHYDHTINYILSRMSIGYRNIQKLNNVINDLLSFLLEKSQILQPELKATTLLSTKLLLEINANGLYAEQMRVHQQWARLASVCRCSVEKINIASSRFTEIKTEIRPLVLDYLQTAAPFFYSYALFALIKANEIAIKTEAYPPGKNFTALSTEQLVMGEAIVHAWKNEMPKASSYEFQLFGNAHFSHLFGPFAETIVFKYKGIHFNKQPILPSVQALFASIQQPIDYFENVANLQLLSQQALSSQPPSQQ